MNDAFDEMVATAASVCDGGKPDFGHRPIRKPVRFTARVTPKVAASKDKAQSWSEWVAFLTANYQKANAQSPVCEPTARRWLEWAAVSLDHLGRSVTSRALQSVPGGPSELEKLTDAVRIQVELVRIRQALEAWSHPPVTPPEGGHPNGHS